MGTPPVRSLLLAASIVVGCGGNGSTSSSGASPNPPSSVSTISSVSPGIELPEVALGGGYVVADDATATVAVSPTALTVRGQARATLKDGVVSTTLPAIEAGERPTLSIDRRLPHATLVAVLHAVRAQRVRLLARAGAHQVAIEVERAAAGNVIECRVTPTQLIARSPGVPDVVVERAGSATFEEIGRALATALERTGPTATIGLVIEDPAATTQLVAELLGSVPVPGARWAIP